MTHGYVLFHVGERTFATPLAEIREIVRLAGLQQLPGTRPPLAGVMTLRGAPLPVLDVRPEGRSRARGDVLVMEVDGDPVGVAVDEVNAVLSADELPEAGPPSRTLPAYVVGVRRGASGPVLLVDLRLLLDATAGGWADAVSA